MTVRIFTRGEWGARYARGFAAAPLPVREIWLHHSVTRSAGPGADLDDDAATVRTLEDIGQQRFGGGISYTFAVTPSGRVFEGHGIDRRGAHTGGRNSVSRAICLIGNYEDARPTPAMVDAVVELLREGVLRGWWTEPRLAGGHRDAPAAATSCPGRFAHARIGSINRAAAAAAGEEDEVSEEFEADVRRMWAGMKPGGLAALERDLRGDLAAKKSQLDRIEHLLATSSGPRLVLPTVGELLRAMFPDDVAAPVVPQAVLEAELAARPGAEPAAGMAAARQAMAERVLVLLAEGLR